jgi:hypothetical protein
MRSNLVLAVALAACALARAQSAPSAGDDNDDDPEAADDTLPTVAALGSGTTLLAEGRRELAAVHESHYAHHTVVDESHGVFDYDCSGFVGYALARVAPHALAAVPGDVIAWLEPAAKRSRNTGHVMIVEHSPMPSARPGEYVVSVMDSSHSGHGARDARIREHRNGLGVGAIVLLVDASGRPTGYRWSTAERSVAYSTSIAFARIVTAH